MKRFLLALFLASALFPADDHPTGNRTTPPTIASVTPRAASRGVATELIVEGLNLAGASAVYFSEPGLKGRIVRVKELPDQPEPVRLGEGGLPETVDLGPLPPRHQVTVEVEAAADADVGPVRFRLLTPLGTTPEGRFLIEPYYGEAPDREPNNSPESAFETYLPAILVGTIARPGDRDYFEIKAKAGEELVFENGASALGSSLEPVIALLAPDQSVIAESERDKPYFAYRFEKEGTYYARVADYQQGGGSNHFYRIKAGQFPVVRSAYPLGVARGKTAQVTLSGAFLPEKVEVLGEPSPESDFRVLLRPKTAKGAAFNRIALALGDDPEIDAATVEGRVTPPVLINGRLTKPDHSFRFAARKGDRLTISVEAERLGSELDSLIEVLDAAGKPVERATARAVWETTTTLADRDSANRGIRLNSWNELARGDYVMIGREIIRVDEMPRTPDEDVVFEGFGGQRLAFFDTSTEAHAIDKPVYKVQIHAPGAAFAPNGLPLVRLYYANDDGGPGYGKDSRLTFIAPADGEFVVRLRDARGLAGETFAYRLAIRSPRPDFELSVNPRNPNVPAGGRVPLTVTALRRDGFDGAIEVAVEGLPAGMRATKSSIAPGHVSTTLLVSAEESAAVSEAAPLRVVGRADIAGAVRERAANPEDRLKLVALMPKADVVMTAETREVVLEPGGRAEITVAIKRQNGYGGRVPVEVRNLPPGVRLPDIGLNGVLINEDEERRSFVVEALPSVAPIEQTIYVAARVETRSPLQSSYAGEGIILKVKARTEVSRR